MIPAEPDLQGAQGWARARRIWDWFAREDATKPGHWLGRFVILRLLGLVYLMAFLTLVNQGPGLLGPEGLMPIAEFLDDVSAEFGIR